MNIEVKQFNKNSTSLSLKNVLRKANKALKVGAFGEAELLFNEILQRYPGNKTAQRALHQIKSANPIPDLTPLLEQNRYEEVEAILLSNIHRDNGNANFWKLLGIVYNQMGKKSLALQSFDKAISLQPNDHQLIFQIGVDFLQSNDIANAFKIFKLLNKIRPDFAGAYTNIGVIYDKVNKNDKAKEEWLKAIEIDSQDIVALSYLGINAIKNEGDHVHALKIFRGIESFKPDDVNNCVNIATAYFELGEIPKALEIYKSWESKNWQGASKKEKLDFKLNYSLALFCSGEIEKAWENYSTRVELNEVCPTDLTALKFPMLENLSQAKGKKIILLMEQGIGDQLFYLGLLKPFHRETNAEIIVQTEYRLQKFLQKTFPEFEIITQTDPEHLKADYWMVYGDLGRVLSINESNVKMCSPYIQSANKLTKKNKDLFSNNKLNIGLVWRSGLIDGRRLQNYTNLIDWRELIIDPDLNLISLQYSDITEDLKELNTSYLQRLNIPDVDLKNDFESLSTLIDRCDFVIGPMTAPIVQSMAQGTKTLTYGIRGKDRWGFGMGLKHKSYQNKWYRNGTHFIFQQSEKSKLVKNIHNHLKVEKVKREYI